MAKSNQAPDKLSLRAHSRNSWMESWIPALFGTAPSRLLKPPPMSKPLDHIYGLNMESISVHTSTSTDSENCSKLTPSKTSGGSQTVLQSSGRKSWHSQSNVRMRRLNLNEAKHKNQNGDHKDVQVTGHSSVGTIFLTSQIWEMQKNTLQYTEKTRTYSPSAIEKHRLRHRASSSTAKSQTKRNRKPKTVTGSVYKPKNTSSSVQSQKTPSREAPKASQRCLLSTDNPSDKVQSKTHCPPKRIIAKAWKVFLYVVGLATVLACCLGIAILIYLHSSRVTIKEILFSSLSLIMTHLRPMIKLYVDEIIVSQQQRSVKHSLVSEHGLGSEQPSVPEQFSVSRKPAVPEEPIVSGRTSASAEDQTEIGPPLWKPFLIGASVWIVAKARRLNR